MPSPAAIGELRVREFLAALGERTPAPASGAAAALTGAFAASLVELAAQQAKAADPFHAVTTSEGECIGADCFDPRRFFFWLLAHRRGVKLWP